MTVARLVSVKNEVSVVLVVDMSAGFVLEISSVLERPLRRKNKAHTGGGRRCCGRGRGRSLSRARCGCFSCFVLEITGLFERPAKGKDEAHTGSSRRSCGRG